MRRISVHAYHVALVFRRGRIVRVLTEGSHWVWYGAKVSVYDLTKAFIAPYDIEVLMDNADLREMLDLTEITDEQLGIRYKRGNFQSVITPGRYVQWRGPFQYETVIVDTKALEIPAQISKTVLHQRELAPYVRVYGVEPYEKGLLYIDGMFDEILEPGVYYFWQNSQTVQVHKADTRVQKLEITGQEILTRDKAALRVNADVQYRITDVRQAVVETRDYVRQLYSLVQMALREMAGEMTLDEILTRKERPGPTILDSVSEASQALGLEVLACGIRDIILPGEMKDIMNQVLVAEKRAQANSIMRREEVAATRSLLNTARLMEGNNMLFRLKEMEYVERIADKISTISVAGGSVVEQLRQIFSTDPQS